jgi:hypothetical protein
MDDGRDKERSRETLGCLWFFGLLGIVIALHFAKLDDTTVLLPDRSANLPYLFLAAGVLGLGSAAVGLWQSAESSLFQRVFMPFVFWIAGTCASFLVLNVAANLVLNGRDFPPEKTHSSVMRAPIARAYQTHGRTASHNIKIMPVWLNTHMYITRTDYDFMLRHRAPTDHGTNPDEISSMGYFCARLPVQISGDAVRVMHAGQTELPKGTVIICPKASKK